MTDVPVPYQVTRVREETADTVSLAIAPVGPAALAPFAPGQFAMVYAFGGRDSRLGVRYRPSRTGPHGPLCGRGVSRTVRAPPRRPDRHARPVRRRLGTRPGGRTGRAGHRGRHRTGPAAPPGTRRAGRPARVRAAEPPRRRPHPEDLLYAHQVHAWTAARGPLHCAVTVDRPAAGRRGRVGVVTTLLNDARFEPGNITAYVCGPEVMIRATARDLLHRGLPAHRIRVSLERNMRCATGHCGHCQLGGVLLCRDGPVIGWERAESLLSVREL